MPVGKWPVDGCMMELDSKTKVGGLLCLPGVYSAQKGSTRLLLEGEFRLCLSQQLLFSPCVLRRAKSLWSPLLCSCSCKPALKWKQMASSQWLVGISHCCKTANEVWDWTEAAQGCGTGGVVLALCWAASYCISVARALQLQSQPPSPASCGVACSSLRQGVHLGTRAPLGPVSVHQSW